MESLKNLTPDGSVAFLPHRLNRQPIVVRGLTANELWICTALAAAGGVVLGVPVAWTLSSVAVIPTSVVISIAAGLFIGGGLLRRHKRGRPETWLYRQMQWWLANHCPRMAGTQELITRSGFWATRRGDA
jgi:conjugative transfer region protein (TIGR03750 family)